MNLNSSVGRRISENPFESLSAAVEVSSSFIETADASPFVPTVGAASLLATTSSSAVFSSSDKLSSFVINLEVVYLSLYEHAVVLVLAVVGNRDVLCTELAPLLIDLGEENPQEVMPQRPMANTIIDAMRLMMF